ncbi:uncharacterized protein DFL_003130 [Arthrobotrys flagrans]|uniref:Lysine-specific metallo-endopeptidase domain-containing protein n=1 Tax=Arthrobotrys flagrans TaxID=97331 RepID=A0A437ADU4_ARTFL|nr:hypothetical protein DFL_003130 [Arthrobotrys flagrans]
MFIINLVYLLFPALILALPQPISERGVNLENDIRIRQDVVPKAPAETEIPGASATDSAAAGVVDVPGDFIPGSRLSIDGDCYNDKRDVPVGYSNRAHVYTNAFYNAQLLARFALKFFNDEKKYEAVGKRWIGRAAEFDNHLDDMKKDFTRVTEIKETEGGFSDYIVLTCNDPYRRCNKAPEYGNEGKTICYVVHESSWYGTGWWDKPFINCCAPFFASESLADRWKENKDKPEADLNMNLLRSTADLFLHEMMHTKVISQDRPKVVDHIFKDVTSRGYFRIYGPKFTEKAARLTYKEDSNGGEPLDKPPQNADSLAHFAYAMFWYDKTKRMMWGEKQRGGNLADEPRLSESDDIFDLPAGYII